MSRIVDEHREYLSDGHRLDAYRRAIEEIVRPGSVVVDLGSGTGIMALLACRAGAKRVYALEESSLIGQAREICRANGFGDRVTFVRDLSTQAALPEPADAVIADQMGPFGFEGGAFEYLGDAQRRFLKPGGILVPSRIDLCVAPVECDELRREVDFWGGKPAGFDFEAMRRLAMNNVYPKKFQPQHLLGAPAVIAAVDTARAPLPISGAASIAVDRAGTLHGIGGWFAAQLSPGVTMSNGPLDPASIVRRNVFFPIDRPVAVEKGDAVRVAMTIRPKESITAWTVEVRGARAEADQTPRARFDHSSFHGTPLSREDLDRMAPGALPSLTPRGEARRLALELCDGRRPLAEIEQEVQRGCPGLFPTLGEAAAFVAEVLRRNAR